MADDSLGDNVNASLANAAQALSAFASGPVAGAMQSIDSAVTRSFNSVANTIARAAVSGKTSIDQLVDAVLADFDRIAISQFIVKPIEGIVGQIASNLFSVSGARAGGGPVLEGQSYLVGEQGPEIFTPSGNGTITPNAALSAGRPSVTINIQTPDVAGFQKSQSQIAALMARALAKGQRNL